MTRMFTGIGIALALVGTAHAQEAQIVVKLQGKSHSAVRAELYRAAESVCANSPNTALDGVDSGCVEATYSAAMRQLKIVSRPGQTALQSDTYAIAAR